MTDSKECGGQKSKNCQSDRYEEEDCLLLQEEGGGDPSRRSRSIYRQKAVGGAADCQRLAGRVAALTSVPVQLVTAA